MLCHQTTLNKFKKIEIISNTVLDYNGTKLEINDRRKTGQFTNMCKLDNTILNSQWVKEEIKNEIKKKNLKITKMETQHTKHIGCCKSSCKREVYSDKHIH